MPSRSVVLQGMDTTPPERDPDRPHVEATDGIDPEQKNIGAPKGINPATGQHKSYWVLSEEERAKGFVRPVRLSYIHTECKSVTKMSQAFAETYAANPTFYGSTFCVGCKGHFPVGAEGEFTWDGTDEKVGT